MEQLHLLNQKRFFHSEPLKLSLIVIFLTISLVNYSQSKFSFGVSGGYNKTFNHLVGMKDANTDAFPDYNIGVDGILSIGERIRLRTDLHYSNIGITRKYNSESTDLRRLDYSKLAISNLDFTPKCEYRLATSGKLDIYASAGFRFEFQIGQYERTFLANGDKAENKYIADAFTKTQAGAVVGFLLKYNISEYMALTLAPEYTYFLDYFFSKNDYKMQRVGVNLGVEWKF